MNQLDNLTSDPNKLIRVEMTPTEYLAFLRGEQQRKAPRIMRGLSGIMSLFPCSKGQAFKTAHEPWFQPARVQLGKLIVFDADKAWELAQANSYIAFSTEKKPAGRRA